MVLKSVERVFIFLLFAIFLVSCSSSKKTVKDATSDKEKTEYDESFDPLKLNDEKIEFKEKPEKSFEQKPVFPIEGSQEILSDENKLIDGFRVQLFATKDIESATIAKNFGILINNKNWHHDTSLALVKYYFS